MASAQKPDRLRTPLEAGIAISSELSLEGEELRELDQMKDLFVSGVSHELVTP